MNEDRVRVPALTCGCGVNPAMFIFNLDAPPEKLQKAISRSWTVLKSASPTCRSCGEDITIREVWLDELEGAKHVWAVLHPDFASLARDLQQYQHRHAKKGN